MKCIGVIYDGKNTYYEKIDRKVARGIGIHKGKLLMLYSSKFGNYSFPGGGMNPGEYPIDCLKREVNEETGIVVKNVSKPIFYVDEVKEGNNKIFVQRTSYFFYEIDHIEQSHKENHEKMYVTKLVSLEEALEKNASINCDQVFLKREIMVLNVLKEEYYERIQNS